jgi:hypothetical protein
MTARYLTMSMKRYVKKEIYLALENAKKTDMKEIDKETRELYKKIEILWE